MSTGTAGARAAAPQGTANGTTLRTYASPLRQFFSASTWRATWFLLAYLVFGWVLWAAVLGAGTVALCLAITLAGLPLLIAAAWVIRGCAAAERGRLQPMLTGPMPAAYRDVSGLGLIGRVRATWTDPAIWRGVAYLFGIFPVLWALDLAVVTIWLTFLGCVTTPLWYWAPEQTFANGRTYRGLQVGYFPHGPHGPGGYGVYVDTLPRAIVAAAVFAVLSLAFQYVVVRTARMHVRVARALLRAPADPLAPAKSVLGRPGPLGPLRPAATATAPTSTGTASTGPTGTAPT